MSRRSTLLIVALLIIAPGGTASPRAQERGPTGAGASAPIGEPSPASPAPAVADLLRYEPTGLSLLRPYARGKVPVVFVHGLWSSPWSWHRMIGELEADPALGGRYQFWTFGYSTGDPIPRSAVLLRRDLDEARRRCDPDRSDPALDRMVVVGHSMGGLLAKMMVVATRDRLWRVVSDRPFDQLSGEPDDRDLFRRALFFEPRPEVRRVIFIATPHQGSLLDCGSLQRVGTRLVRLPDPLLAAHGRLISRNPPTFFREHFRKGLPTSIDELEWGSPMLAGLHDLAVIPPVKAHSIIAVHPESARRVRTDGLVPYDSAHLADAASERVVAAGHLCQDHPDVIREVRRILVEP
jgi:pimeloyl-ACP methyl ester carboxylesterase